MFLELCENKPMKKIGLLIFFIFLFIGAACAESTIKAEVDKKRITADEEIVYKITVVSGEKNSPEVKLPRFDGFNVISSAESSTVSFLNKGLTTHFLFVFILEPRTTGTLKILPATLKTAAGSLATEAFEIEVTPGKKPAIPQDPSQVSL
jgi:hypothetical protein